MSTPSLLNADAATQTEGIGITELRHELNCAYESNRKLKDHCINRRNSYYITLVYLTYSLLTQLRENLLSQDLTYHFGIHPSTVSRINLLKSGCKIETTHCLAIERIAMEDHVRMF